VAYPDEPMKLQEEPDYFGGCPFCGSNDGYLNVGAAHWFICEEHKTKWCAGMNLFSGWRDEDEDLWIRNHETLAGCAKVAPLMPSWCRPVSREEMGEERRAKGWIEDSAGVWEKPSNEGRSK
jgi:hypothetical protein